MKTEGEEPPVRTFSQCAVELLVHMLLMCHTASPDTRFMITKTGNSVNFAFNVVVFFNPIGNP